jgi:spore coat protein CotH
MKYLSLILLLLCSLPYLFSAQGLYDKNTVQTVEVFFSQANWDALLDNLAITTEDYLLADSVRVNGVVFDSVGVKYKGNSSYNSNNNKNESNIAGTVSWRYGECQKQRESRFHQS